MNGYEVRNLGRGRDGQWIWHVKAVHSGPQAGMVVTVGLLRQWLQAIEKAEAQA